jgi:lysophospholipase L1-like esterase
VPSDLVVVQLATNDFNHDVPLPVFRATYNDVLRRVRQASPRAQLLCLGGWDDPGSVNGIGVSAADYDGAAWSSCTIEGGRYVDLSGIYLDARNHGPVGRPTFLGPGDHFHPNDRGHDELAARVLASQNLPYQVPQVLPGAPAPPPSNEAVSD